MSSWYKAVMVFGLIGMSAGVTFAADSSVTPTDPQQTKAESSESKVVTPKKADTSHHRGQHTSSKSAKTSKSTKSFANKESGKTESGKTSKHHHAATPPVQGEAAPVSAPGNK